MSNINRKCCFIIPYFGKFPNYFNLFLKSCRYNKDFNWLIFTDDRHKYDYPNNVEVIYTTFKEIKKLIQSKFNFKISLDGPYKLCDYRPAYGFIFKDYLKNYDFWGYCDIDLIFGNLSNFIDDEILSKYDKIGHLGHLSLYRNEDTINMIFKKKYNGLSRYKEVFKMKDNCIFDEWDYISINDIFLKYNKKIFYDINCADIYPYSSYFQLVKNVPEKRALLFSKRNHIGIYKNGCTYLMYYSFFNRKIKEYSYIHLQKREMKVLTNDDNFIIYPNSFDSIKKNILNIYIFNCISKKVFNVKKINHKFKKWKFKIIVKTHPFRKKIRKTVLKERS